MQVKLSDIPDGGLAVKGEIAPDELDVHEPSFTIDYPVKIALFVDVVDNVLVAKGSYNARVECTCDRCLKDFKIEPAKSDYLFGKELNVSGEKTIDLTEGILEDIVLGLPMKVLCSADCKGICPQCGADLNLGQCSCEPRPNITPFSELDKLI